MAPNRPSPPTSSKPPPGVADPPPQIVFRAATIQVEESTYTQESSRVVKSIELRAEGEDDSDATTNSASTGASSHPAAAGSQAASSAPPSEYETDAEGLPIIDERHLGYSLATLLRIYQIKAPDAIVGGFWTLKFLRRILSRGRVRAQLEKDHEDGKLRTRRVSIDQLVDAIYPKQNPHPGSPEDQNHFLRVYVLLLLCDRSYEIERFVRKGESDKILPIKLVFSDGDGRFVVECEKPLLGVTPTSFNKWSEHLKSYIRTEQRRLLTPYFELDAQNRAKHYDFPDGTILPWCHRDEREMRASEPSVEGGFAFVSKVKIHPTSHGFKKVLQTIQLKNELFALKRLKNEKDADPKTDKRPLKSGGRKALKSDEEAFKDELDNLRRFSGLVHDHLVTLLATFILEKKYYFLFPCAECALDEYWEDKEPEPPFDLSTVRWVSKQIAGITTALDTIHEPRHVHLQTPGEKRYGRHGDLKPDNILLFRSAKDPRGILVISDMGLTSFNRDISRSNIPGRKIPGVPGYRPPECDVEGGKVSRAFDIWTLGCLFLELMTWLLGGWNLVDEFEEARRTVYITGTLSNVFFDIKECDLGDGHKGTVAQVKEEVTQWFVKLHGLPHCTKFVHEVLDLIEKEMLVVLSQDKSTKRSLSGPLRDAFKEIDRKCVSEDYAMKPAPESRDFERAVAVEAEINAEAKETIKHAEKFGQKKLATYDGPRQPSMTAEQLARMDEIGRAG